MLAWGTIPVGAALGGALAQWFGLRAVFAIMGVFTLGLLVPNIAITDERLRAEERRAHAGAGGDAA